MADQLHIPSQRLRDVYTVSRLNREVRALLEGHFPLIWVEGEISNLSRPASGHCYFSLKDQGAQIRCAMFRTRSANLGFVPQNGTHVLARARISLYEPRGDFQLIVEHLEEAGDGALRRAFEALKQRLNAEGLFDAAHKKPLPALPRCVGVVTSPSGAAIRDILTTLKRRFPALPVVIYPVPVQGPGAAQAIAAAVDLADRRRDCDVLIVARGGGSLEDLWAFNEEVVARAVHRCQLPVVVGVGHEIDFTIADFVADRRAPTPTGAAELISPNRQEWLERIAQQGERLRRLAQGRLQRAGERLQWLQKRLRHPGRRLQDIAQRVDELELRLANAQRHLLRHRRAHLHTQAERLHRHSPLHRLSRARQQAQEHGHRLRTAMRRALDVRAAQVGGAARALDGVSPLAVLGRGYALVTLPDGRIVRAAQDAAPGDRVQARLGKGRLVCRVETSEDE